MKAGLIVGDVQSMNRVGAVRWVAGVIINVATAGKVPNFVIGPRDLAATSVGDERNESTPQSLLCVIPWIGTYSSTGRRE